MGIFGRKASTITFQPSAAPQPQPPSMSPEEVLEHAGFQRGWRAETIWLTHQRKGAITDLFKRYGYSSMPAWCVADDGAIGVSIDGQHIGYVPKGKLRKVQEIGDRVAALAIISGGDSSLKIGIHIAGL